MDHETRLQWIQRKLDEDADIATEVLLAEVELMCAKDGTYEELDQNRFKESLRFWKSSYISSQKKVIALEKQIAEINKARMITLEIPETLITDEDEHV